MSKDAEIVQQLVAKINQHDVEGIVQMLSPDHVFTEGLGRSVKGQPAMREAWKGYFAMIPDYQITVDQLLHREGVVLLSGTASGTFAVQGKLLTENQWSSSSVWKELTWATFAE